MTRRHVRDGDLRQAPLSRTPLGTRASRPHSYFRGLRPRAGGTPAFPGSLVKALKTAPETCEQHDE